MAAPIGFEGMEQNGAEEKQNIGKGVLDDWWWVCMKCTHTHAMYADTLECFH